MKISTGALAFINQHFGSAGDPAVNGIDSLVQKIGAQLGAIEEVIPFGAKYEAVVIVKVVSIADHPDADRLHVCKVDDGGTVKDVERDQNGHVQIVCGAPNLYEGMLAAWLPPGSTVPSTYGKDPFVLEARDLRGQKSNGMMASAREMALGDDHDGILVVDEAKGPITPGAMFADVFGLRDDVVIDMENKMFTHRPDCFGWLGIAREIEGIYHRPYKSPEWYQTNPAFPDLEGEALELEVQNELPELVPRFTAIAMRGIKVGPSPLWLQLDLVRAGLRPINNIVDCTNFFMLETGQPLHAYDYDKVKERSEGNKATLVVRKPREGEKITLLNGKEVQPRADAIMIATDKELIGIGGVMGGGDTEVSEQTTNIILEAATFDMYSIRRSSMAHGLFTDAVTRFSKGQSPLQNLAVLAKIASEINQITGATVASPLVDVKSVPEDALSRGSVHPPVEVSAAFINERLGWKLTPDHMAELLSNVEFDIVIDGDVLTVTAPFWRTDIEIPEDVVEEVGRLYGYDHLPLKLPKRDLTPAPKDPLIELKGLIRRSLAAAGANELLTYSFVHGNLLDRVGQSKVQAFQLSNALSPDLQYFRLSLGPSLLERVQPNIKAGHNEFALFEINKVHPFGAAQFDEENLPKEADHLALVFAADDKTAAKYSGAAYYQARKYLVTLMARFQTMVSLQFEPLRSFKAPDDSALEQLLAPYEPAHSAVLRDEKGLILGVVGEYKASVRRSLKLPQFCAGFEIDLALMLQESSESPYVQLPRFPKVEQDICLKVDAGLAYAELTEFVWQHLDEHRPDSVYHTLTPVDIYQREDDASHKQITLRLSMASYERTLTDEEVNTLLDQVAQAAREKFAAERI